MSAQSPWVMVVGGVDNFTSRPVDTAELISVDPVENPVPECLRSLSSYPGAIFAAVGGVLNNGINHSFFLSDTTYKIVESYLPLMARQTRFRSYVADPDTTTTATITMDRRTSGPK